LSDAGSPGGTGVTDEAQIQVDPNEASILTGGDGALQTKGNGLYMLSAATPTALLGDLQALTFTPAAADAGKPISITLTVTDPVTNLKATLPTTLQVASIPPAISGIATPQSVNSGDLISPFSGISIADSVSGATETAKIEVQVNGVDSDANGLFDPSILKTGPGLYTYNFAADPGTLASGLAGLTFEPTPDISNNPVNTTIRLTLTNVETGQSSVSNLTLNEIPQPPNAPKISGINTSQLIGSSVTPFAGVGVSDNATNALDTVNIRVTDGDGNATDANGKFAQIAGATTLVETSPGVYTLSAGLSPADLTKTLDSLVFNASGTDTTKIRLSVVDGQLTTKAQLITLSTNPGGVGDPHKAHDQGNPTPPTPTPTSPTPTPTGGGYLVTDTTTNQTSTQPGTPYSGPVQGVASQYINISPDSLNITAQTPNVFIKSGAGNDALNVGQSNGNNVLDGSTGSNFMVGGAGNDTFFVDDRSAPSDIWSTISNFHAGDTATVFGVTQSGFNFDYEDGQGAGGFTGLTLHVTGGGKPTASFTLAGYTKADMSNGRLNVSFGQETDGTNYMVVQGH
jgi:hypothetical protein